MVNYIKNSGRISHLNLFIARSILALVAILKINYSGNYVLADNLPYVIRPSVGSISDILLQMNMYHIELVIVNVALVLFACGVCIPVVGFVCVFIMVHLGYVIWMHNTLSLATMLLPIIYFIAYATIVHEEHKNVFRLSRNKLLEKINSNFIIFVQISYAFVWMLTGLCKIIYGGIQWLYPSNLQFHVSYYQLYGNHKSENIFMDSLTSIIFNYPIVSSLLSLFTIAVEVLFVVVLFMKKPVWYFLVAYIVLIVGIRVVMSPSFYTLIFLGFIFLPFDSMVRSSK